MYTNFMELTRGILAGGDAFPELMPMQERGFRSSHPHPANHSAT
jgi:hypothetical protein